jgi:hypothetical protein
MTARIAQLFDGNHPVAGPYFAAGREWIGDPAERARIARFLGGGTVILFTTARERDYLDPSAPREVGMSFRTDGEWVWSDGLAYYVRHHGIAPDPDFYRHIRARDYRAADPDESAATAALDALYAAGRNA